MSRFDEEPDDDIHGLCRHEILTLEAKIKELDAWIACKDYVPRSRYNSVMADLAHAELALKGVQKVAHEEITKLRKIAAHVPAAIYIKAKEDAGLGVEVKTL